MKQKTDIIHLIDDVYIKEMFCQHHKQGIDVCLLVNVWLMKMNHNKMRNNFVDKFYCCHEIKERPSVKHSGRDCRGAPLYCRIIMLVYSGAILLYPRLGASAMP